MDFSDVKQFVKECDDETACAVFAWIRAAMEVRGLIPIAGAQPTRKRRSDAGQSRTTTLDEAAATARIESVRGRLNGQSSLSGLPDEAGVEK